MTALFNPARLRLARKRRGRTLTSLAQDLGRSTRILNAYERGEKQPGTLTLERLAKILDFPVSFFNAPDLSEPPSNGTSFRKQSHLSDLRRDQALSSATLALALSDWIEQRFSLPAPDVPRYSEEVDAEIAAQAVRETWGLGERPVSNMIHLLEAHGVRVFSLTEECREMDAISFWADGVPFVFLNTVKSGERSRMDASHELGHLVLHWRGGTIGRRTEHQAQLFGNAFLMPRGSVIAEAPRVADLERIIRAKRRWKVSAAALVYRMHEVGLISDWHYRLLFTQNIRTSERNPIQPETSQVLAKVFKALRDEGITKADIARDLCIWPDELDRMIFKLVLTSLDGGGNDGGRRGSDGGSLRLVS